MNLAARNTWVGRVLVEELARLQTPLVCLAPGARCAPLSMALAAHPDLPWCTFVDERAAAFHASGVGRATERPAVVVTTSGTAVGNLVPAAMEADRAGVPLLLLTADRPADLRETGANQTVRQADVLASLVRHRVDLPAS
ncbi:MAG: thiamine pyrophosphate-binding protein, partial [Myxococcota bacterium]